MGSPWDVERGEDEREFRGVERRDLAGLDVGLGVVDVNGACGARLRRPEHW